MGLGGISMWQLLIILLIVVVIFGTKKLGNIGSDLGGAVKGFRKAMGDADAGLDEARKLGKDGDRPDAEFSESAQKHDSERKRSV